MNINKVADLHIGLSDAIHILGKDPLINGFPVGNIPNQFDIFRARSSDLSLFGAFMCPIGFTKDERVYLPIDQKFEIRQHIKVINEFARNSEFKIIKSNHSIARNNKGLFIGLEGVYFLKTLKDLDFLYEIIAKGVRFIAPVWNYKSNLFTDNNVSSLGMEFLKVCYQNDIVIDLAHAEFSVDLAIIKKFDGRIINSHTAIFELNNYKRNIRLEVANEIRRRRGLIGIAFISDFIGGNHVDDLAKHIVEAVELIGAESISFGSDFDGMSMDELIYGIEDVSKYKNLITKLSENLGKDIINKLIFQNIFRFLKHAVIN